MSAARARRRLMAHERYHRRALLLGLPSQPMLRAHWDLLERANRRIPGHGWVWFPYDPPLHRRRS